MTDRLADVLVLYNIPRSETASGAYVESEIGVLEEVQAVAAALQRLGIEHRIAGLTRLDDLPAILEAGREPVVFNLVEGFQQHPEEAVLVPAVCRAFGREVTGGDTASLSLSLDKWRTKAVLMAAGLPVPAGRLVPIGAPVELGDLTPPYIVKPAACDASEGIHAASSVCLEAGPKLLDAVRHVHEQLRQPAIVEHCYGDRELNISLFQKAGRVQLLPLAEIDFSAFEPERPRIVDYAAKWLPETFEYRHTPRVIPAPVSRPTARRVRELSLAAWRALGCRDYVRVDLRLDHREQPVILEVNVNPDITPGNGFPSALEAGGIGYDEFIRILVTNATGRLRMGRPRRRTRGAAGPLPAATNDHRRLDVTIRYSGSSDQETLLDLTERTGFFRPNEIQVAREVLEDALAHGPGGHYQCFTAEADGRPVGWVCFGPTPCTLGTYDIYWIVVASDRQGRGVGTALLQHAECLIARRGGRLAVAETSGRPSYAPTRRFYEKCGYSEQARVPDFYAPGDDKIIYAKRLAPLRAPA